MKKLFFILISLFVFKANSQVQASLKPGDQAPGFVLNLLQNSIQSFSMPYLNRVVLLHFWSTTVSTSKAKNRSLNRLAGRYKDAMYKTASGFELIAICVQSDKKAWNEEVKKDSLTNFINAISLRGFNDDVCKKYGINTLPTDILIDEKGVIIALNPKLNLIEELLDEKKNFLPIKKDVIGTIGNANGQGEILKQTKLYLFDAYYDSVAITKTNIQGSFTFYDIKLNQDFIIKIDNLHETSTSGSFALFSNRGEHITDGKSINSDIEFHVPSNMAYKLSDENADEVLNGQIDKVNVVRNLSFLNNGTALTPKDEQDLQSILLMLQKNKDLYLTITTHSDSKSDDKATMELTVKQAKTIKDYLIKKGVSAIKIKTIPKGKTQPRKLCKASTDCSDADHKQNRRVEFLVYKN
jgi:outer membrane protein OmpA-like peptidoglycan-associated protein